MRIPENTDWGQLGDRDIGIMLLRFLGVLLKAFSGELHCLPYSASLQRMNYSKPMRASAQGLQHSQDKSAQNTMLGI